MSRFALGAAAALVAAGCGSSSSHPTAGSRATTTTTRTTAPTATAARPCGRPHAAGQFSQSFDFAGETRTYQLYVPHRYTGTQDVPVVFEFHGYGSDAAQQLVYGSFEPEADHDGFLIVAPDGQVPADRHYNLTGEPGLQDDVQMVGALLDHIEATFCVDTDHVYATGMSNGGELTSDLACRMSNRFAAFAAVAAVVSCSGRRPVPIVAFSGTADPVVPFDGGPINCCDHHRVGAAPATMASFAALDKCSTAFTEVRVGTDVRRRTWSGCADRSTVVFYIVDGGGHTWPGAVRIPKLGKTTREIDASATIWRFFQAHQLTCC